MSRTKIITDPDELAEGPRVGDIVTERVDAVGPETDDGTWNGTIVRIEREVPDSTILTIPFDPKATREALCVAEGATLRNVDEQNRHGAREVLGALIQECDRHRPLGPNGKHGQRHTPTCGCDDVPERYRPDGEVRPGMSGTATVRGVEDVRVMRVEGSTHDTHGWVSPRVPTPDGAHFNWIHSDKDVTDFVPDDNEALRAELYEAQQEVSRLGAAFDDVTERFAEVEGLRAEASQVGPLRSRLSQVERDLNDARRELEAEQRGRNALAAGLEAERDKARAELERLRAVFEKAKQDARTVDGGGTGIRLDGVQVVEADLFTRLMQERAARTLPPRDEVHSLLYAVQCRGGGNFVADLDKYVDRTIALFEQGGAAPKVTRAEFTAAVGAVYAKSTGFALVPIANIAKDLLDSLGIEVAE